MGRTYYKYAERQANNQIDWFQVGKDLTDMLKKQETDRETKRAAIDEASRKFGQELENAPQGTSDVVNQFTTDYAGDMQAYRLNILKLLKQGQLKPKEYALINQNNLDGTKNLFALVKEYQDEHKIKMERAQNSEASASEAQFMAMVEGFGNIKDTKALINPTDGSISVGKMVTGKDGVKTLAEGPENYMTVTQLRNRIKQKINKYDLNTELDAETKLLGPVVTEVVSKTGSSTQTGFMTKVTDPTQKKGLSQEGQQAVDAYIETEKKIVASKLSNPFNVSSILFDWTGGIDPKTNKPYQVTLDPKLAETSSHYILWTYQNGILQPNFEANANGKEQFKTAQEYTKNKFRSMLEQKTELQPFQQPRPEQQQQWQYEAGQKKKQEGDALALWQQIYSGKDTNAKETAKQGLLGTPQALKEGLIDIDVSDGKNIKLIYSDAAKNRTIKLVDKEGKPVSGDQFAASGTELHGVTDRNKFSKFKNERFATEGVDWANVSGGRAGTKDINKVYGDFVASAITTVPTDETAAVKALSPNLNKLGFTVKEADIFSGQAIKVVNPNGEESETIYLDEPDAVGKIQTFLLTKVPGEKEEDKLLYLNSLIKKGSLNAGQQGGGSMSKYNKQ
jgi:hypothetical protein